MKPKYHHIDKGIAPKVNACKAPGEWQTLDIVFIAPRFDKEGKKIKNAMIAKAVLNGQVIHEICEALATDEREVSPTRFHNSVHNASAGYWGIATRSQ